MNNSEWIVDKDEIRPKKNGAFNPDRSLRRSYSREILDETLSRIDIISIIEPYVELLQQGSRWRGLCPFHSDNKPSFYVMAEEGRYKCFGCGKSGDAISFLREIENLTFGEAVRKLRYRAGLSDINLDDMAVSESRSVTKAIDQYISEKSDEVETREQVRKRRRAELVMIQIAGACNFILRNNPSLWDAVEEKIFKRLDQSYAKEDFADIEALERNLPNELKVISNGDNNE